MHDMLREYSHMKSESLAEIRRLPPLLKYGNFFLGYCFYWYMTIVDTDFAPVRNSVFIVEQNFIGISAVKVSFVL